jgi:hypothetical protein
MRTGPCGSQWLENSVRLCERVHEALARLYRDWLGDSHKAFIHKRAARRGHLHPAPERPAPMHCVGPSRNSGCPQLLCDAHPGVFGGLAGSRIPRIQGL